MVLRVIVLAHDTCFMDPPNRIAAAACSLRLVHIKSSSMMVRVGRSSRFARVILAALSSGPLAIAKEGLLPNGRETRKKATKPTSQVVDIAACQIFVIGNGLLAKLMPDASDALVSLEGAPLNYAPTVAVPLPKYQYQGHDRQGRKHCGNPGLTLNGCTSKVSINNKNSFAANVMSRAFMTRMRLSSVLCTQVDRSFHRLSNVPMYRQ